MTDRELLELAAMAHGRIATDGLGSCYDMSRDAAWNPRKDDGDALRLLCECSMRIIEGHGGAYRAVQFTLNSETEDESEHEVEIEWPHTPAAHREAITRAAAEIGKAKRPAESVTTGEGGDRG